MKTPMPRHTGGVPEYMIPQYVRRVQRQCARDHEDWGLLDVQIAEYGYALNQKLDTGTYDWDLGYVMEKRLYDKGEKNGWNCLPWPLIRPIAVRKVYNTKSECWLVVEVEFNDAGARAIYGISKFDGRAILWAD